MKIKNYICPGSFYVALTRVRMGIKVNKSIEENVGAMRKFRKYNFKKIYRDERNFETDGDEVKLNIDGLVVGNHNKYLNDDHHLKHLF